MLYTLVQNGTGQIIQIGKGIAPQAKTTETLLEGVIADPKSYYDFGQSLFVSQLPFPVSKVLSNNTWTVSGIPLGTTVTSPNATSVVSDGVLVVTSDISGDIVLTLTHPQYITHRMVLGFT